MTSVKCRHCRTWFERPPNLEPHIPAVACPAFECQQKQRQREEEIRAARLALEVDVAETLPLLANRRARWRDAEVIEPECLNEKKSA